MFDEPSSFLDIKQRLSAAKVIRSLLRPDDYVICVEHDLSVLDYLSDFICVLYGKPYVSHAPLNKDMCLQISELSMVLLLSQHL